MAAVRADLAAAVARRKVLAIEGPTERIRALRALVEEEEMSGNFDAFTVALAAYEAACRAHPGSDPLPLAAEPGEGGP